MTAVGELYWGQTGAPNLAEQIFAAVEEANSRTARTVTTFAEALQRQVGGIGSKVLAAHTEIAHEAQAAVVAAYEAARSSGRQSPPYRSDLAGKNHRYAGGALLRALQDPAFVVATPEGINYANLFLLDITAKQWARLNFGAGGAGGVAGRSFAVRWSNLVVASLGFAEPARAPFSLPAGFWLGEAFYPLGTQPPGTPGRPSKARPTRGIAAEQFLDAGLEVIANLLPEAYSNIFREMFAEARTEAEQVALQGSQIRMKTTARRGQPTSAARESAERQDIGRIRGRAPLRNWASA